MKRLITIFVSALCFAFLVFGCDLIDSVKPETLKDNQETGSNGDQNQGIVKPDIQYLRSPTELSPPSAPGSYPSYFVFKSETGWKDYIAPIKENYDAGGEFPLAPAVNAYNGTFFQDHNLVMILLEEGSGSTRHEVETAGITNNELNIRIKKLTAEAGTTDMAYWHIFIPVKKDFFDGDMVTIKIVTAPER